MHDVSKPILGDKNKKNISKCHLLLLVGQVVFWVWGKLFGGLVLCGANCLEAKSVVSDVLSDINDKYGYI